MLLLPLSIRHCEDLDVLCSSGRPEEVKVLTEEVLTEGWRAQVEGGEGLGDWRLGGHNAQCARLMHGHVSVEQWEGLLENYMVHTLAT